MAASDAQVQAWSDRQARPRCEQILALYNSLVMDISQIDDVYAACTAQNPTWTDQRGDSPPHLLGPSDILAVNSMVNAIKTAIDNNGSLPVIRKAIVRT